MPVKPVLVILTATLLPQVAIKQMPADVTVLDRMDIPGIFKRASKKLTPEQVNQVYEQGRRSSLRRRCPGIRLCVPAHSVGHRTGQPSDGARD